MSALPQPSQTETRLTAMLRSAFKGPVGAALVADDTIEILANPDGSVWIEAAGSGLRRAAESLGHADRERIIRLVASSVRLQIAISPQAGEFLNSGIAFVSIA